MFASKDLFLTRPSGYQISRSVRLRSSASAYFNRTPTVTGNRKTWTWSAWVKRGALADGFFIVGSNGTLYTYFAFISNAIQFQINTGTTYTYITTALFRDPSAWYHIVFAVDTTQASDSNRVKIYVNNVLQSNSLGGLPQNSDTYLNASGIQNWIASNQNINNYFDGYMTEINFIDGQALTPSSFGQTNTVTGVWQPIKYTGTYGTNGFYLNFSDNSGVTATTIGKDYSGNGNNWTPSAGISITAGATYDSMLDVPTLYADGGNGRGNYSVWNPLKRYSANMAFSNANLTVSDATTSNTGAAATMRTPASGKWYWEITATTISGILGYVVATTESNADSTSVAGNLGGYRSNGSITNLAGTAQTSGATYASGDVIGVAVDVDNGTCQFYKNGAAQGATPSFTFTAGTILVPAVATDNSAGTKTFDANFGQRPFTYTPPTGFKALNTQNLPEPTISNGANYMAATLYTGNGSTQSITNTVNGVNFQPDMVWAKNRSNVENHQIFDSVRGVNNALYPNLTNAAGTDPGVTAFNSNGFSLGGTNNANAQTYVGWQWQAGQGSTSSNTSGSITSTVSVNATAGFSVVTCTFGNGSIGHGLGVAPKMIIGKGRGPTTGNWIVFHSGLANMTDKYLNLNGTAAVATLGTAVSAPTSTLFYGNGGYLPNAESAIFYCFAAVAGYSAFGSYTGNNSTDGVFVYLGFRPRFIMIKSTSVGTEWVMIDTARSLYNLSETSLYANRDYSESTIGTVNDVDILSNGFKLRNNTGFVNASQTYIYAAFAENPFKLSLAR